MVENNDDVLLTKSDDEAVTACLLDLRRMRLIMTEAGKKYADACEAMREVSMCLAGLQDVHAELWAKLNKMDESAASSQS